MTNTNTDEPRGPTVRRTRKGSAELVVKRLPLDEYQRQVLLYANGRRSIEEICAKVPMLDENPDLIIGMEEAGLIELIDPEMDQFGSPEAIAGTSTTTAPQAAIATSANQPPIQTGTGPAISPGQLSEMKTAITSDLIHHLGSESDGPIQRIEAVSNGAELKSLGEKLVELIKLYKGNAAAENFASRHLNKL